MIPSSNDSSGSYLVVGEMLEIFNAQNAVKKGRQRFTLPRKTFIIDVGP